jgi:hypothetical protein
MAVSDECKLEFQDLKAKRSFRFITFKINEQTQQVVVDRLGQPGDTYDDFTSPCHPGSAATPSTTSTSSPTRTARRASGM